MRAVLLTIAFAAARAANPPFGPLQGVYPLSNLALGLRHCNYICSACPLEDGNEDFMFNLVAPLNGGQGVSFQSVGYPDHYLAIANTTSGAAGIVATPDVNDASWTLATGLVPAPAGANNSYSIQSQSKGQWGGQYLTKVATNNAPCNYQSPAGDVILTSGADASSATWIVGNAIPPPPANVTLIEVNTQQVVNPAVNKRFMGCHHDYGFAQAPRFFTSNLIYGESFEAGTFNVPAWTTYQTAGANAAIGLTDDCAFSGKDSMGISIPQNAPAGAEAALVNRGMGGVGLVLQGGQPYEFKAVIYGNQDCTAYVELVDRSTNTSLARQEFAITATGPSWGSTWLTYNFTITPSANTTCVGIPWNSDPTIDCGGNGGPAYICMRCGGEFRVGVVGTGSFNLGWVQFQPGSWGRVQGPNGPLPVLQSAADVLQSMGVSIIRSGGTVSQSMRWRDWRPANKPWNRAALKQVWGESLLSNWGPFEVIDMCNALGIEPVITLAYDTNSAADFGDLVEYAWGDATTTTYGRLRAADGHPAPYNVTVFELGNEQYNPDFVAQVVEMEARAAAVGAPPLHYMFPSNGGVNAADAAALMQQVPSAVPRILPDLHVGAGGAVEAAASLFNNPPVPGFNCSAINAETNAGTHDLQRALDEAADLIDWFISDPAVTNRLYARTASFCSGTAVGFDSWDQGISFFLPNMTWFQPPGYVHVMIQNTWADVSVQRTFTSSNTIPFAAQLQSGSKTLVLRAVNSVAAVQPMTVTLQGSAAAGPTYTLWTLSGGHPSLDNTPSNPTQIAPVQSSQPIAAGATTLSAVLPPYTFAVMVIQLQ